MIRYLPILCPLCKGTGVDPTVGGSYTAQPQCPVCQGKRTVMATEIDNTPGPINPTPLYPEFPPQTWCNV